MSPRAACRLEGLGFEPVYDYVAGKADWVAHGLALEGAGEAPVRTGHVARTDVATVGLHDDVRAVRAAIEHSPYGFALAISEERTLLGRIRKSALERLPHGSAEQIMEPGPTTVRPDTPLDALAERMREHDLRTFVVSDPEGRLVGVVRRDDVETALGRSPRRPS